MSVPSWFYPIVLVWLIINPTAFQQATDVPKGRSVWNSILDTLFLLPWILSLVESEPVAAWIGLEVVALVMLFDLLWKKPTELLREAWVKLSLSWLLSWILVGTAVALSGVHPMMESLFYPLPAVEIDRMRPVLAGLMFFMGLSLKLGLPPFQQGTIDLMAVIDPESHRRWALQLRWAIAFAAWQLVPALLGPLSAFNQQLFASILLFGGFLALLVASVQASVQRTLSYMGSLLVLPSIISYLFMDPRQGLNFSISLGVWLFTILGFLLLAWVYFRWSPFGSDTEVLLWEDKTSPCHIPGWFRRWNLWTIWSVLAGLLMAGQALFHQQWWIASLSALLTIAAASNGLKQLGITLWKQHNSMRT